MPGPEDIDREELRRIARDAAQGGVPDAARLSLSDVAHLIQEFGVYQNELLAQNEELSQLRSELETARDGYRALYEFAPVGYLTLEPSGSMTDANLAGCRTLATERGRLLGTDLARFVAYDDKERSSAFLRDLPEDGEARADGFAMRAADAEPRRGDRTRDPGGSGAFSRGRHGRLRLEALRAGGLGGGAPARGGEQTGGVQPRESEERPRHQEAS